MSCAHLFRSAWANVKLYNVVALGLAFMFIFTAFTTTGFTAKNVMTSVTAQTNGSYQGDAYLSNSIIYISFAISNWIAPAILSIIGVKFALVFGAVPYCLYVASFIYPLEWTLYLTSTILGIGAAALWTAQGVLLTECSDEHTMTRNTAVFLLLFQSSLIIGNLIEFVMLKGQSEFDESTRITLFAILTAIAVSGIALLLIIRKLPGIPTLQKISIAQCGENCRKILDTMKRSWRLFRTRNMIIIMTCFAYSGLSNAFRGGIFPSCVGQNLNFEDPKALIGVVGFTVGIAEVFGAALMLGIGQKIVNRFGRDPLVVTTFLLHTTGYLMSYLVFPDDCPVGETNGIVFVNSRMMAVAAAFLLGLGDAIFMTALFSLVNKLFGGTVNTAPAFALATFMQSLTSGASFFYAGILLQYQLLILFIMNVLNVVVFVGLEFTFLPRRTPHNNVGDVEIQKKPDDGDNKLSMSLPHSQTAESTLSEL